MKRLALALLLMTASSAQAVPIFSDDFQSGRADAWKAVGRGDVRLSTYQSNASLKLSRQGAVVTKLSTKGFRRVAVTLSFAAMSLGPDGACVANVSLDGGITWIEVFRIGPGMDDGVTLHPGGMVSASFDDRDEIDIAVRETGGGDAVCWADNVKVTGKSSTGPHLPLAIDPLSHDGLPVDMRAFAIPTDAQPSRDRFEGHLSIVMGPAGHLVLRDEFGDSTRDTTWQLPQFDFDFVQAGDVLIPAKRGAIPGAHPEWEYILEPGRVWRDGAWSRASLPFTLEERNANCMHNGVLMFLFKGDGTVSQVVYQIGSETCRYFKFDLWGRSTSRYVPGKIADADRIVAGYRAEIASRLPTKPIEVLAVAHPGVDLSNFGSSAEVDPDEMTTYGVVLDGVNYVGACDTRFGPYPYCDELDLPSYSLAKSIFAGIGSMRLTALYPGVMDEKIADHVPECAAAKSWGDVTFANSLDMASGHYISSLDQADEDSPGIGPFFNADKHAGKIDFACNNYPRKSAPGTLWVYHTADTYALGTALRDWYRKKTGGEFYPDVLAGPLWRALKLDPAIDTMRHTYDAVAQPFAGYGLTLHRDDVAKFANFLGVDGGRIAGKQMLDSAMLAAALQKNPADTGLAASSRDFRYHDGFWAWNAQSYLGCAKPAWIPFMSGYGGIVVALMPNGLTYYYFSDGGTWAWARAAAEADRIKPFCER